MKQLEANHSPLVLLATSLSLCMCHVLYNGVLVSFSSVLLQLAAFLFVELRRLGIQCVIGCRCGSGSFECNFVDDRGDLIDREVGIGLTQHRVDRLCHVLHILSCNIAIE
jgi:hypothetical protein